METFDLSMEQATVEAVKEFQLRGVLLDGINTRALIKQEGATLP